MTEESKYQPLQKYLEKSNTTEITLTFTEIEEIMGDTFPDFAHSKRQWWGNRNKLGTKSKTPSVRRGSY
ncbi:hypothetical protein NIES2101_06610 [Calothrix sp. HK-06]|nr:hypothetical protein NIES2101_06610 [Calothrix sp. HK-06]